jgi:hypothetical protein
MRQPNRASLLRRSAAVKSLRIRGARVSHAAMERYNGLGATTGAIR